MKCCFYSIHNIAKACNSYERTYNTFWFLTMTDHLPSPPYLPPPSYPWSLQFIRSKPNSDNVFATASNKSLPLTPSSQWINLKNSSLISLLLSTNHCCCQQISNRKITAPYLIHLKLHQELEQKSCELLLLLNTFSNNQIATFQ